MRVFEELGRAIEAAWEARDFDERAFPAVAAAALRERQAHRETGAAEVLRRLLGAPDLLVQHDLAATFGAPPITVNRGRRFFIATLLWTEGSTVIHRHPFSGAFQVLDGSSLHTRYAFAVRRRVSARLLVGDLSLLEAAHLARGAVAEITEDLIHGLFHLETPSATVVVRTGREADLGPAFAYLPPSVAEDPLAARDEVTVRRRQALRFARRAFPSEYPALAASVLAGSDLHTTYVVLRDAFHGGGGDPGPLAALVEAAKRRHGAVVDDLLASIRQQLRDHKLARLYARERDEGRRLFLALLRNLPDREAIYAVVREMRPGCDPRAEVLAWARSHSGTDAIGVDLADPLNLRIFEALLDGCAGEALLARLGEAFDPEEVAAAGPRLLLHAERIRETSLAPLLRVRSA